MSTFYPGSRGYQQSLCEKSFHVCPSRGVGDGYMYRSDSSVKACQGVQGVGDTYFVWA